MKEKPPKPMQKDVKDTRNATPSEPKGITTKNKSFPNYRPSREQMPDLQAMPKTLPQNSRATTIAAMAQGEDTQEKKREGFDKYNVAKQSDQPNAAFLNKSKNSEHKNS